jgi:hypothetical protein
VAFKVALDTKGGLTLEAHRERGAFQDKLQSLRRSVAGALEAANAAEARVGQLLRALDHAAAPRELHERARGLQRRLRAVLVELRGDQALQRRQEGVPPSISQRANTISGQQARTLAAPTATQRRQYELTRELFTAELAKLSALVETELPAAEREAERAGAPWTPGRMPAPPRQP